MKKAQVSMEFLYTYGWALMITLISFGVLGYIVFSDSFVSDTCYISDGLSCSDYAIRNGEVLLKVQNIGGVEIDLVNFECKSANGVDDVDLQAYFAEIGENPIVSSGGFSEFKCNRYGDLNLRDNKKEKVTFVIVYKESGKQFNSYVNGYLVATNRAS